MRKPTFSKSTWRMVLIIGLFGLTAYGVVLYYQNRIRTIENRMDPTPSPLQTP